MWKLWVAVALVGCSQVPTVDPVSAGDASQLLASERYFFVSDDGDPMLSPDEVFMLDESVKGFLDFYIGPGIGTNAKQEMLVLALGARGGLDIDYDPAANFSARSSFHSGRANCISYSILVGSMADYVGLPARYYEVDVPPVWELDQGETLMVNYKHVNVRVGGGGVVDKVIDINMDQYRYGYPQRSMRKTELLAHFYNNLGVDAMRDGSYLAAHRNFRQALEVHPDTAFVWGNLGVLLWRMGHAKDAEQAFSRALTLDPAELSTISNLARLRANAGQSESAAMLNRLLARHRASNPYFQYVQAQALALDGRYSEALNKVEMALESYPHDLRFYHLQAKLYWQLYEPELALRALAGAVELAESYKEKQRFSSKFEALAELTQAE